MRNKSRWIVILSFIVIGWSVLSYASNVAPPSPKSKSASTELPGALAHFAGNLSCSATSCHGAVKPREGADIGRNEFTIWLAHDQHRNAYNTLLGERAKTIAKNLAPLNGGKVIPTHEDERCLACHTTPQAAFKTDDPRVLEFRKSQGIGCEACHGPANQGKGWLAIHTTDQVAEGMVDVSNLGQQAKMCAGCHLGAPPDTENGIPARDLNHDLMAAGHPRLIFEFSSYRLNMPPHWNVNKKSKPDESKVWAMGQIATAQAQIDLTVYRAGNQDEVWPEFSETGCFACHADFQPFPSRSTAGYYGKRTPGDLTYNEWYLSMVEPISAHFNLPGSKATSSEIDAFALAMGRSRTKRSEIVAKGKAISEKLGAWLHRLSKADHDSRSLLQAIVKSKPITGISNRSWDVNLQLVLGLAALHQDWYNKRADKTLRADQEDDSTRIS